MKIRLVIPVVLLLMVSGTLFAFAKESEKEELGKADQIERIIKGKREMLTLEPRYTAEVLEGYLTTLGPDGKWPDIDYNNKNRSVWATGYALLRAEDLAKAYRTKNHPLQGDKRIVEVVNRALHDWKKHNYRNPNWYYASIGIPKTMGTTAILMGRDLDPEIYRHIAEGVLGGTRIKGRGQNLLWISENVLHGALLRGDLAVAQSASHYLKKSVLKGERAGIQHDWSYHLHGAQNQLLAYGGSFAADSIRNAYAFRGTDCSYSESQLEIIRNYLTEGIGWAVWKGLPDPNFSGRGISHKRDRRSNDYFLSIFKLAIQADPKNEALYQDYITRNSGDYENNLIGNKNFWKSDAMIHRANDWYASVKMCSRRIIGGESSNSENLRGFYAGDGALLLNVSGREYEGIFPIWDWTRLPGVTCVQASKPPKMSRRLRGKTHFVGTVSNKKIGHSALDYHRGVVKAKKSYFFFEDVIVCMGSGLTSTNSGSGKVMTSLNQCFLNGNVQSGDGWYWHDSIGYQLLGGAKVAISKGPQEGKWSDLTTVKYDEGDSVKKDVFSLAIDHGKSPQNDSFAYMIYPGASESEMKQRIKEQSIKIVEHSNKVHAVYDHKSDAYLVTFWSGGSAKVTEEKTLTVDKPCLAILEKKNGAYVLTVSDPTQKLTEIGVELTGAQPASIKLPEAPLQGSSVEVTLTSL